MTAYIVTALVVAFVAVVAGFALLVWYGWAQFDREEREE